MTIKTGKSKASIAASIRAEREADKKGFPAASLNETMNFSGALEALKRGDRVRRAGWNGENGFIFLVPGSHFIANRPPLVGIYPSRTEITYHSQVDMKTAQGDVEPWLCSQADLLADDWRICGESPEMD